MGTIYRLSAPSPRTETLESGDDLKERIDGTPAEQNIRFGWNMAAGAVWKE